MSFHVLLLQEYVSNMTYASMDALHSVLILAMWLVLCLLCGESSEKDFTQVSLTMGGRCRLEILHLQLVLLLLLLLSRFSRVRLCATP